MLNKLTLFDKVLIALALLGVIFFGYIFFRKSTYVTATIKVGDSDILYDPWQIQKGTRGWFDQLFQVGMKEQDGLGRVMAQVTDIYSYDTTPVIHPIYLTVKLNAVYNRASDQHTFKGTPLTIGSPVQLNLDKLLIKGIVINLEGTPNPRVPVNLQVTTRLKQITAADPGTTGVDPHIPAAIHVGDQIQDNHHQPIISIIELDTTPAALVTTTNTGQVTTKLHPLKVDTTLILDVQAYQIDGKYFLFDDIPIKIGSPLPLNFPTLNLVKAVSDDPYAEVVTIQVAD
jgi:hypothetical protein